MTKVSGFAKYIWVLIPVLMVVSFVWCKRQDGNFCSSICQCAGCEADQEME